MKKNGYVRYNYRRSSELDFVILYIKDKKTSPKIMLDLMRKKYNMSYRYYIKAFIMGARGMRLVDNEENKAGAIKFLVYDKNWKISNKLN